MAPVQAGPREAHPSQVHVLDDLVRVQPAGVRVDVLDHVVVVELQLAHLGQVVAQVG